MLKIALAALAAVLPYDPAELPDRSESSSVAIVGAVENQTEILAAMAETLNRIEERMATQERLQGVERKLDQVLDLLKDKPAPAKSVSVPSKVQSVVTSVPSVVTSVDPGAIVLNPGERLLSIDGCSTTSTTIHRTSPRVAFETLPQVTTVIPGSSSTVVIPQTTTPGTTTYRGPFRRITTSGGSGVTFDPVIGGPVSINSGGNSGGCVYDPNTGRMQCPTYNPQTVTTPANDLNRRRGLFSRFRR